MKVLKVFIKPYEAPQVRKYKFKLILVLIQLSEMQGAGALNIF